MTMNRWSASFHVDSTWGLGKRLESKNSHSMSQDLKADLKGATSTGEMLTVYAADRPVTFLQTLEAVIEPGTKLTVEHCKIQRQ